MKEYIYYLLIFRKRIQRDTFLSTLRQFDLPQKFANFIKSSILNTKIKIQIGNSTLYSQGTEVTSELRHGNSLSSLLFKIVLENVIRENNIKEYEIRLDIKVRISIMDYAGNTV